MHSFWNFDALFQPQQHPARDAHDTFFLKGFFCDCWASKVFMCGFFFLIVIWFYICRSFHHKGTSRRLCGAGEAGPWDWWLWIQRVWYSVLRNVIFLCLLSISEIPFSVFFFFFFFIILSLSDMDIIGKERKQIRTYCELIQLPWPPGCYICLHR